MRTCAGFATAAVYYCATTAVWRVMELMAVLLWSPAAVFSYMVVRWLAYACGFPNMPFLVFAAMLLAADLQQVVTLC